MDKIVHLEDHFPTGEMTVQPVVLWANGKPCVEHITKHASVGHDYFKTINPIPGKSIVYVLAVSSWEYYGENRNGDSFPELPYKEDMNPPWISSKDTLLQHYKSFETHAHNYRHHANKDPEKAVGSVMKAFWNPSMHRVELLVMLVNSKAPDLAERIAAGEYPPVSMGTRVPYDVCSICGNRAPTRAQYCDHLKFQMKAVINGMKVSALNPSPKFFDISWVFRPADPTAYMLKKVAKELPYEITGAAAGEYLEDMAQVKAAAHKLAVIDKVVQGVPVDARSEGVDEAHIRQLLKMRGPVLQAACNSPDFPDEILDSLSTNPMGKILSTMFSSGIMLSTPEFTKIVIRKSSPKMEIGDDLMDKCVAAQNPILELFEECPQILEQLDGPVFDIRKENVDSKIAEAIGPWMEKRSGIGEYLKRKFIPENYRDEMAYTTPLSLTDPVTGQSYGTTRGAAIRAHDEIAKRNLYKVMGGAALLGGAYKLIGSGLERRGLGKIKPLVGLTLGALGLKHWPSMGEHYMTDQGVPVPTLTELAPIHKYSSASSLAIPLLGTLGLMTAMGQDYTTRLGQGIPVGHPVLPFSRRLLDQAEQFTHEHPLISAVGGTLALRSLGRKFGPTISKRVVGPAREVGQTAKEKAKSVLRDLVDGNTKVSHVVGDLIPQPSDSVILPRVDLDKLAERIGEVIVEG